MRSNMSNGVYATRTLDKRGQSHEALQPAHAGLAEICGMGDVAGDHLQASAEFGHEYQRQLREAARSLAAARTNGYDILRMMLTAWGIARCQFHLSTPSVKSSVDSCAGR